MVRPLKTYKTPEGSANETCCTLFRRIVTSSVFEACFDVYTGRLVHPEEGNKLIAMRELRSL